MSIVTDIANSIKVTKHPKYVNTPFEDFAELSPNTKGRLVESMVNEILINEGHDVFDNTNKQHDLRVRFKGENHKTKLEVKSAMYKRTEARMDTGQFHLAHDFDELLIVLIYPNELKGYRVNRSILRGMDKNGLIKSSKSVSMITHLTSELLEAYDCQRVI